MRGKFEGCGGKQEEIPPVEPAGRLSATGCWVWYRPPRIRRDRPPGGWRKVPPDDRLGRTIQHSKDIRGDAEKPQRTGCPACAGHDGGAKPIIVTPNAMDFAEPVIGRAFARP